MANRTETPQAPDAGFPTPVKVDKPPRGQNKPNPAVPVVKAALDQGWQRFESATEKAAKEQRQQVSRAKDILGVKARTKTHKDENGKPNPLVWYMLVESKASTETDS